MNDEHDEAAPTLLADILADLQLTAETSVESALFKAATTVAQVQEEFDTFKREQLEASAARKAELEQLHARVQELGPAHLADIKRRDALLSILRELYNAVQLVPTYDMPEQVRKALARSMRNAKEVIALTAHLTPG
jgi:hypothetical protein